MKRKLNLGDLSEQQLAAVTAWPEGPIIVYAGPGSGKTKVLTERIAWLVNEDGVPPDKILAMTFSVKAAEEMRSRCNLLLGNPGAGVWIGTFHKVCREILNQSDVEDLYPWRPGIEFINDDRKRLDVVEAALREIDQNRNQLSSQGKEILEKISFAKSWLISPEQFQDRNKPTWDLGGELENTVADVYPLYQSRMQSLNVMDSDDQLMQTLLRLQKNARLREQWGQRFHHVLVDEFQDLNRAQYCLTQRLGLRGNIFIVGDADQAIYGWRGADPRNFEHFRQDFPDSRQFFLSQNYRSKPTILHPAQKLIKHNQHRKDLQLFTQREAGPPIHWITTADEREEAKVVVEKIREQGKREAWSDYAVLYRQRHQHEEFVKAFHHAGIPCREADEIPLYRWIEIRDMLAYLRLCVYPDDEISFQRVINVPRRWIGPVGLGIFFAWAREDGLKISEALMEIWNGASPDSLAKDKRWLEGFRTFAKLLFRDFRTLAMQDRLTMLFDNIRESTAYDDYIDRYSGSTEQGESPKAKERKRNLDLLRNHLERAEKAGMILEEFLHESDIARSLKSGGDDAVSLMTLHRAKGLEFPIVFITGLEEGRLPDYRSAEVLEMLEEERRLLYVGMTRAQDELYLTRAKKRKNRSGKSVAKEPSAFVPELDHEGLIRIVTKGATLTISQDFADPLNLTSEEQIMTRQLTREEERRLWDDRLHSIYRFDPPNGKYCYIGLTNNMDERISYHCSNPEGPLFSFLSQYRENPAQARQHFQVIDRAIGFKQAEEKETATILSAFLAACEDPAKPLPRNKKSHEIGQDNFKKIVAIAERARLTHGIIAENKRMEAENKQLMRKLSTEVEARERLEHRLSTEVEARKQLDKLVAAHSAFNFALIAFIVITTIVIFTP